MNAHDLPAASARRSASVRAVVLALLVAAMAGAAHAQVWHYTLGEERRAQQAHFCVDSTEVLALAGIFRDKGPRPGFFALKQLFDCATRIDTFTPLEIVEEVAIATQQSGTYTVTFVRVRLDSGATSYLVTTRAVQP